MALALKRHRHPTGHGTTIIINKSGSNTDFIGTEPHNTALLSSSCAQWQRRKRQRQ
jgi:hypothetical protein